MEGRVEKYDPVTRTADIRVLVKRPIRNVDTDETEHEELPILPSIPVCFPGAGTDGAIMISWPIAVGTLGLVLVQTLSGAKWRTGPANGAQPQEPGDQRTHHPGNARFLPGILTDTASTPATAVNALVIAAPEVRLGDHTAIDPVALEPASQANLDALVSAISGATAGGNGIVWTPPVFQDMAATKVKAI